MAGLAVLGAAPAFAAHDTNPSATAERYSYSLALDRFPVADQDGNLRYTRTFTPLDATVRAQAGPAN